MLMLVVIMLMVVVIMLMVVVIMLMLEIRVRKGKVASGPGGGFTAGV